MDLLLRRDEFEHKSIRLAWIDSLFLFVCLPKSLINRINLWPHCNFQDLHRDKDIQIHCTHSATQAKSTQFHNLGVIVLQRVRQIARCTIKLD